MLARREWDNHQRAVHDFSKQRWPDMTIETEALALAEEAGEVCRAVLKRHHSTRGTQEAWTAQIRKEVAQVAGVLFNIAAIEGFSLVNAVEEDFSRWQETDVNHDPICQSDD